MSGDTYYRTDTENKNNTPPPSPPAQRAQSDAQIAKAFGKMTVGAAQVTAVAVGLAVYGAVKGSIALAKWGAKAYKKHKEENELAENLLMQKMNESVKKRREKESSVQEKTHIRLLPYQRMTLRQPSAAVKEIKAHTEQFRTDTETKLLAAEKENSARLSSLENKLSSDSVIKIAEEFDRISDRWKRQQKAVTDTELKTLHARLDRAFHELRQGYEKSKSMKQADRLLAEQALSDARCLTEEIAKMPGTAVYAEKDIELLCQKFIRAAGYFERNDYELCYAEAADLIIQSKEVCLDIMKKSAESKRIETELLTELAGLAESTSADEVEFVHKGRKYKDNLHRFCPDGWKALEKSISAIFPLVHENMTEAEIHQVKHLILNSHKDLYSVYRHSWNKLIGAYHENDVASDIARTFKAQGYEVEGHAYECGVEGEKLHINFINRISKDRVTLVLDADGKDISASLHQYASSSSRIPDEEKQNRLMELVGKAIRSETGKNVSVVCKTPHQNSTETKQADLKLHESKKQNINS